jgi:16S rRNA (guanine(966)-N(2))-methyltransferase RsmD
MRVISGRFKGRKLIAPQAIRPTEDKVRKALFDIMRNVVPAASFLDLYAGCGAVGIEALSWGASRVFFVEKESQFSKIIEENIANLKIDRGLCPILTVDAEVAIQRFKAAKEKFELVFIDPPYYQELAKKTLQTLGAYDIVAKHGFIIVQHHRSDKLSDKYGKFKLWRANKYSTTMLSFYTKR